MFAIIKTGGKQYKIKENDTFAKNMNKEELYKTTKINKQKVKIQKELKLFDEWMSKLIAKNGTTLY